MIRRVGLCVGVFAALALTAPALQAQEEAVAEAVRATLEAWSAGDFDRFAEYYHPDVRGFFLDGSPLVHGFQIDALRAAHEQGLRADMSLRDLEVRVLGDKTAATAGYLDGTIGMPGGMSLSGSWRYTETRVLVDGVWKVVQYHFSQMAPEL